LGKCGKFGEKDIISGEIIYDYAGFCRKKPELCGMNARYYTSKTELNADDFIVSKKDENISYVYQRGKYVFEQPDEIQIRITDRS
jgi:hypothetical protein